MGRGAWTPPAFAGTTLQVFTTGIKQYYRRYCITWFAWPNFLESNWRHWSAASVCGKSVLPAAWCCSPYLVSHFLNHALGNSRWRPWPSAVHWHILFWQFPPVGIVFYACCLVHTALGIWALYQRRQFPLEGDRALQLVLGLSIPALIITHIVGVRIGQALYGHQKLYPQVFFAYWIVWPLKAWLMFAVITIAWVHGCIGLYFWLRMKAFFKTAAPFSARRGGADSDAGDARPLSRRTKRRRQTTVQNGGRRISCRTRSAPGPNRPY